MSKCNICGGPYKKIVTEVDPDTGETRQVEITVPCLGHEGVHPRLWNKHNDHQRYTHLLFDREMKRKAVLYRNKGVSPEEETQARELQEDSHEEGKERTESQKTDTTRKSEETKHTPRPSKETSVLAKAKAKSAASGGSETVELFNMRGEREFFRFQAGELVLYDRVGRNKDQVRLTLLEVDEITKAERMGGWARLWRKYERRS